MLTVEQIEKKLDTLSFEIWALKQETQEFHNWRTMELITEILRAASELLEQAAVAISED